MERDGDGAVEVVRERRRDFGDEIVRIRVLRVPPSEKFPEGIKYAFHFGSKGSDDPIIRYATITASTSVTKALTARRSTIRASKRSSSGSSANFPTTSPPDP
ncbi:hypothetical protein GCM10028857_21370 [Salinarchaeum chitinilyticum]